MDESSSQSSVLTPSTGAASMSANQSAIVDGSYLYPTKTKRLPIRKISVQDYIRETSADERTSLAAHLANSIVSFVDGNRPVYLEGLGILAPQVQSEITPRVIENKILLREESVRRLRFEKCSELIAFQRAEYSNIVETTELTQKLYPTLPLPLQLKWTEAAVRRYVRGFMHFLGKQIVVVGFSNLLNSIGDFYALHNRQGSNLSDWFAGADIILEGRYSAIVKVGAARLIDRPVLCSPWEIFEAAFGAPLKTYRLDLKKELEKLGAEQANLGDFEHVANSNIAVAAFDITSDPAAAERTLLYCSDGVRKLHSDARAEGQAGNEFITQVCVPAQKDLRTFITTLPEWPLKALHMAWVLLESSKSKTIRPGAGLSLGAAISGDPQSNLKTIFATRFPMLRYEQLCKEGPFYFINITAITDDEARVAKLYSAEHLTVLLRQRGMDQLIRPRRLSVVAKSGLLVENDSVASTSSNPTKQFASVANSMQI